MGELVSLEAYRRLKEEERKEQEAREAAQKEELLDYELEDLKKSLEIMLGQFMKSDSKDLKEFYSSDDYNDDYSIDYYWGPSPYIVNSYYDKDGSDYEDEER